MFEFKVLDGFLDGDRFILRGILGHSVFGSYNEENLRSMARLIDENGERFIIRIDEEKTIIVGKEQSIELRKEYLIIADELY